MARRRALRCAVRLSVFLFSLSLSTTTIQAAEVKGIVVSAESGEALEKVSVYLAGTGAGIQVRRRAVNGLNVNSG